MQPPAGPSLSLCITTRGPAPRVRALLELIRPHADEVVLAADADGGTDTLAACADLADRCLSYDLHGSPARLVGWIQHQCAGDWILRLDDDEVPSTELLSALPTLIADRRITEVAFRRRWLYGDAARFIATPPWGVDYQPRLIRNLPGLWSFAGAVHTVGAGPASRRLVAEPFYHLDLLLASTEERRRKVRAYEDEAPGLEWDAYPVNGVYLPEDHPGIATRPVPDEHRAAIEGVLRGAAARSARDARVEHATAAQVADFNSGRSLAAEDMSGAIEFVHPPERLPAGSRRHVELTVRNDGGAHWPGDLFKPDVKIGFRWRSASGHCAVTGRRQFTEPVDPGQTTRVLLALDTPLSSGPHTLEVDLVWRDGDWFGSATSAAVEIEPRAPGPPSVRVHVTSIDTAPATELCVRTLREFAGHPFRLTVGDGGSTDGSLEMLRGFEARGSLELQTADAPFHAQWLDRWLTACDSDYAVFVDSDVEFREHGWLADLVDRAERTGAALVYVELQPAHRARLESHGGRLAAVAARPGHWLLLVRVAAVAPTGLSFEWHDEVDPEKDLLVGYDIGARLYHGLAAHGLEAVGMPESFRRKCHHYGGLSWPATARKLGIEPGGDHLDARRKRAEVEHRLALARRRREAAPIAGNYEPAP